MALTLAGFPLSGDPMNIGYRSDKDINKYLNEYDKEMSFRKKLEIYKGNDDLRQTINKITVELSDDKFSGSGLIIDKLKNKYYVITAWHVFKNNNKSSGLWTLKTFDGKRHNVKRENIVKIKDVDMALVIFSSNSKYDIGKVENMVETRMGDLVYSSGYVHGTFKLEKGQVIANSIHTSSNGLNIIYSNKIIPGMSGGPILNSKGKVIGINGTTNHHLLRFKDSGGYARGVPIHYYNQAHSNFLAGDRIDNLIVKSVDLIDGKENYSEAIKLLNNSKSELKNSKFKKTNEFIFRKLCYIKNITNDFKGSIEDCNNAIKLNNKDYSAYVNRCSSYGYMKKFDKAKEDCMYAIKLNPVNPEAYTKICFSNYLSKSYENALINCSKAIELDSKYETPYNNRCAIFINLKKFNKAAEDCKRAISIKPNNSMAYTNLCVLEYKKKEYYKATNYCNNALDINPKESNAYITKCAIKLSLKKPKEAIEDCRKAININPNSPIAYSNMCTALLNINEIDKAEQNCLKAIEIDKKFHIPLVNISAIKINKGNYHEAIQYINMAILVNESYGLNYINRGISNYQLGRLYEGCKDWVKAFNLGSLEAKSLIREKCNGLNRRY